MKNQKYVLLLGLVLTLIIGFSVYQQSKKGKKTLPVSQFKKSPLLKKGGTKNMITVTSPAFQPGELIPKKYTCDGQDINPPLRFNNLPDETKSLVLIVDDPDAPMGTWNHWLVWNLPPTTREITEGFVPQTAVLGTNDFGQLQYGGPCPPSGTHRYFFRVYALDTILKLPQGAKRNELEQAMKNHIISQGELMGRYQR